MPGFRRGLCQTGENREQTSPAPQFAPARAHRHGPALPAAIPGLVPPFPDRADDRDRRALSRPSTRPISKGSGILARRVGRRGGWYNSRVSDPFLKNRRSHRRRCPTLGGRCETVGVVVAAHTCLPVKPLIICKYAPSRGRVGRRPGCGPGEAGIADIASSRTELRIDSHWRPDQRAGHSGRVPSGAAATRLRIRHHMRIPH